MELLDQSGTGSPPARLAPLATTDDEDFGEDEEDEKEKLCGDESRDDVDVKDRDNFKQLNHNHHHDQQQQQQQQRHALKSQDMSRQTKNRKCPLGKVDSADCIQNAFGGEEVESSSGNDRKNKPASANSGTTPTSVRTAPGTPSTMATTTTTKTTSTSFKKPKLAAVARWWKRLKSRQRPSRRQLNQQQQQHQQQDQQTSPARVLRVVESGRCCDATRLQKSIDEAQSRVSSN